MDDQIVKQDPYQKPLSPSKLAIEIKKLNDDMRHLSFQNLSIPSSLEMSLCESIQNDLLDPNLSDKERIYLRRLKNKLRVREIERNQEHEPFNIDKRIFELLVNRESNRDLRDFHSKRTIFNFISSIGEITSNPNDITPKKIRKTKDKVKKDPQNAHQNQNQTSKDTSKVSQPSQPESVKLKKNGCVTSAEMETHLQRTLSKDSKSLQSQYFSEYKDTNRTFEESLFGDIHGRKEKLTITSPWSGKVLKPFIRRDTETLTARMKLHEELIQKVASKMNLQDEIVYKRKSIDYCYLRPEMVGPVNSFLIENFWPEIDISESLIYPEHTVVVLYGKYIIGAGFITPSGYITYICVHSEFQNAGIGKFMLYHLIQTCPGKDITLHVSVNNPALILYQTFSFKIEEFIRNFYDKYLPENSRRCKHAFFLRLRK